MDTFVEGLAGELQADFNLAAVDVTAETTVEALARALDEADPGVLVVLDNPTAELYRRHQQASPPGTKFPPAVIAMSLFVEQTAARIENATGIAYEVPAVTSLVRLRSAVAAPIVRVGVVHRPAFRGFVADQARLAAVEGFQVLPMEVRARPGIGEVRHGLRTLDKLGVDALWVLNDNVLLSRDLLLNVWLPVMRRTDHPVIVGVADLLRTDPPVGTFAVLPDHQSLGMQAAELVFEIRDAGWSIAGAPPQLPIAVETMLDRARIEAGVGLQPGALDQIDRVVE